MILQKKIAFTLKLNVCLLFNITLKLSQRLKLHTNSALQIRASKRSITTNLQPLTPYIYHVMIIVAGGFSKKSFFLLLFPRNSFEQS